MKHLQGRHIDIRTWQDEKLNRLFRQGSDQLNAEAEKGASFECDLPSVDSPFYQARTANADVVTDGHWEGVDQILATQVEGFKKVSQIIKQDTQGRIESMQALVEGRLSNMALLACQPCRA